MRTHLERHSKLLIAMIGFMISLALLCYDTLKRIMLRNIEAIKNGGGMRRETSPPHAVPRASAPAEKLECRAEPVLQRRTLNGPRMLRRAMGFVSPESEAA